MQIISTISVDEGSDLSAFKFNNGSKLHLLLPAAFFTLALLVVFGFEYYKDWKRKRRLNRYWQGKTGRPRS